MYCLMSREILTRPSLQSWTRSFPDPGKNMFAYRYRARCAFGFALSGGHDCASPDRDAFDGIPSGNRDEPYTTPSDIAYGWPYNPDRYALSLFAMPPFGLADRQACCSTGDSSVSDRE